MLQRWVWTKNWKITLLSEFSLILSWKMRKCGCWAQARTWIINAERVDNGRRQLLHDGDVIDLAHPGLYGQIFVSTEIVRVFEVSCSRVAQKLLRTPNILVLQICESWEQKPFSVIFTFFCWRLTKISSSNSGSKLNIFSYRISNWPRRGRDRRLFYRLFERSIMRRAGLLENLLFLQFIKRRYIPRKPTRSWWKKNSISRCKSVVWCAA